MLATISFDDQVALLTYEISNERADRLLAPKLGTIELTVSQRSPKLALSIGHLTTQALSL
jgi:hypothetical protein